MKPFYPILIVLFLLSLQACEMPYPRNLASADILMGERPNSAPTLENILEQKNELLKEKQQKEIILHGMYIVSTSLLCTLGLLFYLRRQKKEVEVVDLEKLKTDIRFQFQEKKKAPDFKMTKNDWMDLEKQINEVYRNFSIRLRFLHTKLTDTELRVCMLVKIGISNSEIASLMYLQKNSICSIRSRLYKKIYKRNGSAEQFDTFIREL